MDPFAIKVPLWTPEPEFNLTTASVKGNPKASEEDITKNLPKVTQLHQPGPGLELREPQDSGCLAAGSFCQKLINQIVHHRIPPPVSPNRPYVQILLQKTMPAQALCDTGADISCINPNTLKELPCPAPPGPNSDCPPLCKGASRSPLHDLSFVVLQINLGSQSQMHKFRIIQGLQEKIILGTEFMQQHNLLYDPNSRTLLKGDPAQWDTGIIAVEEALTLPALSSTLVKIRLKTTKGSLPGPNALCSALITDPDCQILTGGPS